MMSFRTYSSKILLFGEYTVLHGSKGLAMPYVNFSGRWIYDKTHNQRENILKLKNHLHQKHYEGKLPLLDFDELEFQYSKGLSFESTIPNGYGIGSSGAISAAIFDTFFKKTTTLELDQIIQNLAIIENCFHGKSSGLDPLVSYFNQPILIHGDKSIELLDATNSHINEQLFLIDTQIKRSTGPLVQTYLDTRKANESFLLKMQDLALLNDDLVTYYLANDIERFEESIKLLSRLQLASLSMMIPDKCIRLWKMGLETSVFSMKLNGAGGGGFMMIYAHEKKKFESILREEKIHPIQILKNTIKVE